MTSSGMLQVTRRTSHRAGRRELDQPRRRGGWWKIPSEVGNSPGPHRLHVEAGRHGTDSAGRECLQFLSSGGLTLEQKRLRIRSLAADLEGAEVLTPSDDRNPRRRSSARVIFRRGGHEAPEEDRSTGPSASLTESHARELCLELVLLLGVAGVREAVRELEKALLFLIPGIEPVFDQGGDDAAGARLVRSCQRLHAASDARRETDALPDLLINDRHRIRIQQSAPVCTRQDSVHLPHTDHDVRRMFLVLTSRSTPRRSAATASHGRRSRRREPWPRPWRRPAGTRHRIRLEPP